MAALASKLDDEYFELQDRMVDSKNATGYLRVFRQARAVAALSATCGEFNLQTAMDAIYEAYFSSDDQQQFTDLITACLQRADCY